MLMCSLAFAQSAPAAPTDPGSLVVQLLGFITTGHGMAAVGVGLMLFVWGIQALTGQDSFWKTTIGENLLAHGIPAVLYVGTALASGTALSLNLIVAAVAAGFAVKGVLAHLRSIKAPPALKKAAGVTLVLCVAVLASALSASCQAGKVVLNVGQCILDTGIQNQVLVDLASDNYAALIAQAIADAPALVKCALTAIAAGGSTGVPTDAGVVAASKGAPYSPQTISRAKEMLAKYGGI
jgi:hypothetical protein